jgi:uncharacterized membrane protein YeiH
MPDIFDLASWVGAVAFALSGYLIGARKNLDIMGIFIVSMLTANGGGVVRDVLVGQMPILLHDVFAFLLVGGVVLVSMGLKLHKKENLEHHTLFLISDSLGLVAFSVTGALVGIDANLSVFGVMLLAFITATGGGFLRDILLKEIPFILSSDFYGTIALIVGALLYMLHQLGWDSQAVVTIVFIAALLIRLIAWKHKWRLPKIGPDITSK